MWLREWFAHGSAESAYANQIEDLTQSGQDVVGQGGAVKDVAVYARRWTKEKNSQFQELSDERIADHWLQIPLTAVLAAVLGYIGNVLVELFCATRSKGNLAHGIVGDDLGGRGWSVMVSRQAAAVAIEAGKRTPKQPTCMLPMAEVAMPSVEMLSLRSITLT